MEAEPAPVPFWRRTDAFLTVLLICDNGTVLWRYHRQFISSNT